MGVHTDPDWLEELADHVKRRINEFYHIVRANCSEFYYSEISGLNEELEDAVDDLFWNAVKWSKAYNNYYYENEKFDTEGFKLVYTDEDEDT